MIGINGFMKNGTQITAKNTDKIGSNENLFSEEQRALRRSTKGNSTAMTPTTVFLVDLVTASDQA